MNRRLFVPLLVCGLLLTGCYRQADDSFEQVDSQSVQSIESPTVNVPILTSTETDVDSSAQSTREAPTTTESLVQPSKTDDPADVNPTDVSTVIPTLGIPPTNTVIIPTATGPATPVVLTPEAPPGQVELPTVNPPTATPTFDIIQPTSTDVSDGPQAGDECIHVVVAGDTLFRISINNGTTVEAVQQLNGVEGDAIQIGQLLRIPGCVVGQVDEPTAEPSETAVDTLIQPTPTDSIGGSSIATVESVDNLPTAGQQIHVVVSGETLGAIANRYGTTIAAIIELNFISDPDALAIGDELLIPASN